MCWRSPCSHRYQSSCTLCGTELPSLSCLSLRAAMICSTAQTVQALISTSSSLPAGNSTRQSTCEKFIAALMWIRCSESDAKHPCVSQDVSMMSTAGAPCASWQQQQHAMLIYWKNPQSHILDMTLMTP